MLIVTGLEAGYGKSRVLFDINLSVAEGELVTLMGRNGMGKTTTVRSIMGLVRPTGGTVRFDGDEITRAAPEKVARLGIGLVPEGRRVFRTLTVRENLVATSANRLGRSDPWTLDRVAALFPRLGERFHQRAGTLSGGEQQMLAIGRALMTNPRLLILDEATEGLAPLIRAEIWACIERLKAEGQSILLIDKNLSAVKSLASAHFIIEKGRTVWTGTSAELDADHERTSRYIGL
ncbi:ABC transporter ATP-binding protein [Acuticoccus sp. M5D2P5]|uniref:ABC transporter ATP-binding protein n=1 Tax=Acuticoccus kalidii TaxID=2910977 RepID=UPI001F241236|nr:ABC transporter ATP-binding protein [Acuticoccus kalidii]MCF3936719.1 ABC transporter ATP-binding protein [Acuticoccus kalidii]